MESNKVIISEWAEYLGQFIRRDKTIRAYLVFVEKLVSQTLPVIFELNHLAELVGIKTSLLASLVNRSSSFYRDFEIPKRKGGVRVISTPSPSLLLIQRWISNNILQKIPTHSSVHGFVRGRSIVTNAQQHCGQECLLKMDIADFFPSISIRRVIEIFKRCGYPNNVSYYLASICCLRGSLPQGAATSPLLSNIVFKRIDRRLCGLSSKWKITYTRYADDLAFSGMYIPLKFSSYVSNVIEEEGFKVNPKKTILIRNKGKKIVTGISVSG